LFDKKALKEEDKKLINDLFNLASGEGKSEICFMTREKSGFENACEYFVDKCSKYNGDVAFHWKKEELMISFYSEDSKKEITLKTKR
jgi:hypothetical protein